MTMCPKCGNEWTIPKVLVNKEPSRYALRLLDGKSLVVCSCRVEWNFA